MKIEEILKSKEFQEILAINPDLDKFLKLQINYMIKNYRLSAD